MLFFCIVLARLFYILNPPPSVSFLYSRTWYLSHPFDLQIGPLAVWSGGLDSAGALIGAVFGSVLVLRRRGLDFWLWGDILTPGMLVVLTMAPWGNLLSGQMLGAPTNLPWGVATQYPLFMKGTTQLYPENTHFHPVPAYISIVASVMLLVVLVLQSRITIQWARGTLFLSVSMLCLVFLFFSEWLRIDTNQVIIGLTVMQILSLLLFISLGILSMQRYRKSHSDPGHGA
jgi:phosphatidylglycerol:prolipoprotein diacylglycerol transferase